MPAPYQRLPLDSRASDVGLLRFWAAIAAIIGAIWLAVSAPPWWAWIAVAGAAFIAFFWLRRWRGSRALVEADADAYLELREDGFTVAQPGATSRVAWTKVRAVEADEERVAVRVDLADTTDALYVEPTWGGLGLYELEAAIRAAREASPSYLR
ncbi:MAG: hypothetical protein KC619_10495 [Myxococcales bacterium]|nr:hypothetical protein [Myxococcales bacterium]